MGSDDRRVVCYAYDGMTVGRVEDVRKKRKKNPTSRV